ncbi:MAG: RecQ family ATP-dependent DNA helicase [Bryobacteraceae bacterium]
MRDRALQLLRQAVGSPSAQFHPGQWEAIEALVERRERLLVVQRTGWGKSIVYFIATKLLRERGSGCALLVSPLLALMRNQIEAARRIGVRAETINSTNVADWRQMKAQLLADQFDILLISPERLANEEFLTDYLLPVAGRIGLFVVDEAHCISDWGHDFRPDYRRIVRILKALPRNLPVLATTATANDRVVRDIVDQLGSRLKTIRGPLVRESLWLENIRIPSQAGRMAWLADRIPSLEGSGIVYTLTVRDADHLSAWLRQRGIDARAYHAGREDGERRQLEDMLLRNEVKALVATVALGMGFDKPDLGFVIHFQRPASVVHYYQQVGRAGRAIDSAHGVLLSGAEDDEIADYFIRTAFPSAEEVGAVLDALGAAPTPLNRTALQMAVNLRPSKLDKSLKFLSLESPAPIQRDGGGFVRAAVRWQMPAERIDRITSLRRQEQARMNEYLASGGCLMEFLARELSDPDAAPCGKCANCTGQGLGAAYPEQLAQEALQFLGRLSLPIEPRKQWPASAHFEGEMRTRIDIDFQAQEGRALCKWGDAPLGDLVREGKRAGRFSGRLVDAAAETIRDRWKPQPAPQWITCVPSRRHIDLVPDFARRLAAKLGLPFVECIRKARDTGPQKSRQNSFQQVANLENAFDLDAAAIRGGPVLLVDDMVDSRWTFAVLAWKLLHGGAGPVFPFALADTSADDGE